LVNKEKVMNTLAKTAVILSTLVSAQAFAVSFSDYDLDQDGYITQSEAKVSDTLTQIFDRLDVDRDGKLSMEEFKDIES